MILYGMQEVTLGQVLATTFSTAIFENPWTNT